MSNLETASETAIIAGGCFWCTEAVFRDVVGVIEVESGYIGGHVPSPSYKEVCGGATGHADLLVGARAGTADQGHEGSGRCRADLHFQPSIVPPQGG